jgi:hypothetical protein
MAKNKRITTKMTTIAMKKDLVFIVNGITACGMEK